MSNVNIDKTLELIAKEIYTTAFKQELRLKETVSKGIFFMPELAFVFECGIEIMKKKYDIFRHMNTFPEMKREENLGNGGPSDLIFDFGNSKIIIEFKMIYKEDDYHRDIKKLKKLDNSYTKLFCALTDVTLKDIDICGRINLEKKIDKVELLLDPKKNFFYVYDRPKLGPVVCTVGL